MVIFKDDKLVPRKQRHTAKRIFDRLKDEHNFTGGYAPIMASRASAQSLQIDKKIIRQVHQDNCLIVRERPLSGEFSIAGQRYHPITGCNPVLIFQLRLLLSSLIPECLHFEAAKQNLTLSDGWFGWRQVHHFGGLQLLVK